VTSWRDILPTGPQTEVFKNIPDPSASDSSLGADETVPNLKMAERPDWALFRTIDGLQQKAGVPAAMLRLLVMKEIADNAYDTNSPVTAGILGTNAYFVEDLGPGLDGAPEEIADLFSIRRAMRSSKLLRLPQRGALGNGLRVVAGAVLASEGSLAVVTRNQRINLRPEADGSTTVVKVSPAERSRGTRIEIGFGPALPGGPNVIAWVRAAAAMAQGETYTGKSSPHWYDPVQFHELLRAHAGQPVRSLIAQLDGCSGGKAGEIVAAAGLDRLSCEQVSRAQATILLEAARKHARLVNPERLGFVGREAFPEHKYAIARTTAFAGSAKPQANIPFVVEAWARKTADKGDVELTMFVNRTVTTGEITTFRDSDKDVCLFGSGLNHDVPDTPTKGAYDIKVNIITPHCPITSDGKAPDLELFAASICEVVSAATRKAQRAAPKEKRPSQKDVVLENLEEAIANASGHGEYRFNERQIFYQLRPIVLEETGRPLLIGNFKAIITDYENENGEIEGMYREPRGSMYHPHRREDIPLGTLMVEDYERPIWTFNKLIYIEKEGFSEALKDSGWPERHDCALMSSKGFTTRAARDLVDKLTEHDEPCTIYCVHDADAWGTMIFQTFQEETRARGARKIKIVNLGLEPWEAVDAGLEVEDVDKGEKHKPVAEYVLEREEGDEWEDWLQNHRVELNAMTTPEFIEWLDAKMAENEDGKLIPPEDVIQEELEEKLEASIRDRITERILAESNLEGQVRAALEAIERPSHAELITGTKVMFDDAPEREWRAHVDTVVAELLSTLPAKGGQTP
jgi:hypothetical protein